MTTDNATKAAQLIREKENVPSSIRQKARANLAGFLNSLNGETEAKPRAYPDLTKINYNAHLSELSQIISNDIFDEIDSTDPHGTRDPNSINFKDSTNGYRTQLHLAVLDNNLELVEALVASKAVPTIQDGNNGQGLTAIQLAASLGYTRIHAFLLRKK